MSESLMTIGELAQALGPEASVKKEPRELNSP